MERSLFFFSKLNNLQIYRHSFVLMFNENTLIVYRYKVCFDQNKKPCCAAPRTTLVSTQFTYLLFIKFYPKDQTTLFYTTMNINSNNDDKYWLYYDNYSFLDDFLIDFCPRCF